MKNKNVISNAFSKNERKNLPVNYFLLREVEVFKVNKRIGESDFHRTSFYGVGFYKKPISLIIGENEK